MLIRIGACLLVLSLTGPAAAPPGGSEPGAPGGVVELSAELLRLDASARRARGRGLLSPEVLGVLPALARLDDGSPADAGSEPVPAASLLRELWRLANRVHELEAELETHSGERPVTPLVRITVARHE